MGRMSNLNIPELCAQVYARVFSRLVAAGYSPGAAAERARQAHDRARTDLAEILAPSDDQPAPDSRRDAPVEWLRELYSRIADAPVVGSSLVAERYRLISAGRVEEMERERGRLSDAWEALGSIASAAGVTMEGKSDAAVAGEVIAEIAGRRLRAESQRQIAEVLHVALQNLGFTGGGLDAWVERARQALADAETMRARWEEMAVRLDKHEQQAEFIRVALRNRLELPGDADHEQIAARIDSLMLLREQVAEHLGPWCGGIAALGAAPKLAATALRAAEQRVAALENEVADAREVHMAESHAAEEVTEKALAAVLIQRDELLVAYRLWRSWAADLGFPLTYRTLDTAEHRRACADEDLVARQRIAAQLQAAPAAVETARLGDEVVALRNQVANLQATVASLRGALAAIRTEVHLDSTAGHHEIRRAVIARLAALGKDAEGMRREITSLRSQRDAALRTIDHAIEMLERFQAPGDGAVLHLCAAGALGHIDRQAARIAELEAAVERSREVEQRAVKNLANADAWGNRYRDALGKIVGSLGLDGMVDPETPVLNVQIKLHELAEAKAARDHFARQATAHEAALAVADVVRDEAKRRCFHFADTNLAHVAANMFDTDRENFEHLDAALKAAEVDQPSDLVVWCRARRLESRILAAGQEVGEAVRRFAEVGEALSKVLAPR